MGNKIVITNDRLYFILLNNVWKSKTLLRKCITKVKSNKDNQIQSSKFVYDFK